MVCPSWFSFILYNPVRKALTDRSRILSESGVTRDSVVLEVGAGNGFLTEVLAQNAKKVYAVELQEGMIRKLRKRVARFGERVSIIKGDIASISIDKGFADVCLLYYSFHEFHNPEKAAEAISLALRPYGVVAVYEPTIEVGRLSMLRTVLLFEKQGLSKVADKKGIFTRFVRMQKT